MMKLALAAVGTLLPVLFALLCLVPAGAQAGVFADEVAAAAPNHFGHDHANETNEDVAGAAIDAGCQTLPATGCPTYRRSILLDSDFTGASFDGANFELAEITDTIFSMASFVGANLDDALLIRVDFSDADLSAGAMMLNPVSLRRAQLRGGLFHRTDFSDADLVDTQFRCIANPEVDPDDDDDDDIPSTLCPEFIETDFTGADMTGTRISPSFTGDEIPLSGAIFREAMLVDAIWAAIIEPCIQTDADLNLWTCIMVGSGVPADPDATVESFSIQNASDIRGSDWRNLTLRDFDIGNSEIAGAMFTNSVIEDADFRFVDSVCLPQSGSNSDDEALCDFLEANGQARTDFTDAQLTDVRFDSADLSFADFTDATLTNVSFDNFEDGCAGLPDTVADCFDCVNFAGALDGQVALPDDAYNISIEGLDWLNLVACSALSTPPLIDDLSHIDLDSGSFRDADVTALGFTGSSLVGVSFQEATITGVNFDDADLRGSSFREAVNGCADAGSMDPCPSFNGADLSGATLIDTALPGSDFDDSDLEDAVATNTDFSGASFVGSASDTVSFARANLSASNFDAATIQNADFSEAVAVCGDVDDEEVCSSFRNVAFADSLLVDARFTGADLSGATFVGSDLTGADFSDVTIDATTSFSLAQIDGLRLVGVDLSNAANTLFQGKVDFDPGDGDASDAQGVDLTGQDLTGFDFSGLELIQWNFDSTDLTGTDFSGGANLQGARFRSVQFDTLLPTMNVTGTDLFAGADLTLADLRGLDLTGANLSGADLTGANVENTDFTNADLTGADLDDLADVCDGSDCATVTGAQLSCATLVRFDFNDLDSGQATDEDFFLGVDPDLSGFELTSQNLFGYQFDALDLTRANFDQNDVRTADFTDATLHGTRFTNGILCSASGTTDNCPTFSSTDLVGSTDCNDQEGANFTGVNFGNAPLDLFTTGNIVDDSFACVNFTNADLSFTDNSGDALLDDRGFNFPAFTDFAGAVLAGASLRHQDFEGQDADFFQQFQHAPESIDDLCSDEDDDVAAIDTTPDFRGTDFSCATIGYMDFSGADMAGANFTLADLVALNPGSGMQESPDFTGTTLSGLDASGDIRLGPNFAGVDFSGDDLDPDLFQALSNAPDLEISEEDPPDRVDEFGVFFPNLQLTNFAFANLERTSGRFNLNHVDVTNANLSGANFRGVDLGDAVLDGPVSLCDVRTDDGTSCTLADGAAQECLNIDGANVVGTSFRNTQFGELFEFNPDPDDEGPLTGIDDARLFFKSVENFDLTGTNFTGSNIAGLDFSGLDMTDAAIFAVTAICDTSQDQGCANFEGTTLASSDPANPLFIRNLANPNLAFDFGEASIAGAEFDNVDLTNVDFSDVGELCIDPVAPSGCLTITGVNSILQRVNFNDLDLRNVDFGTAGVDGVADFTAATFRRADLTNLTLEDRDFTNADFTSADLTDMDLEGSTLSGASFACDDDDGCSLLDGATLCGVEARLTRFEGSFDGTSFFPAGCSEPADLSGARFSDSLLATLDLSMADLQGAVFETSVDFCNDNGDCLVIDGATLVGVDFTGVDFDELPAGWLQDAGVRDLRATDFEGADLSGKAITFTRFDRADFSAADLRDADLRNSVFQNTEFARGGQTNGDTCSLASGGSRVDLRGANLSGADFSRARNFQRGCVRMDATTRYDANTRFPAGFDLLGDITLIPEPRSLLLEVSALLSLALLAARRRRQAG